MKVNLPLRAQHYVQRTNILFHTSADFYAWQEVHTSRWLSAGGPWWLVWSVSSGCAADAPPLTWYWWRSLLDSITCNRTRRFLSNQRSSFQLSCPGVRLIKLLYTWRHAGTWCWTRVCLWASVCRCVCLTVLFHSSQSLTLNSPDFQRISPQIPVIIMTQSSLGVMTVYAFSYIMFWFFFFFNKRPVQWDCKYPDSDPLP